MISPNWLIPARGLSQLAALLALALGIGGCATHGVNAHTASPQVACSPTKSATPIPSTYYIYPGGSKDFDIVASVTTNSNVPANCTPPLKLLGGSVTLKATQGGTRVISSPGCLLPWAFSGSYSQLVPVHFKVPAEGSWAISSYTLNPWWKSGDMTGDPCNHALYLSAKPGVQAVHPAQPEVRFSVHNFNESELTDVKAHITINQNKRIVGFVALPSIPKLGKVHQSIAIKGPLPPVGTQFNGVISGQAKLHGKVIKGSTSVRLEVTKHKPWWPFVG